MSDDTNKDRKKIITSALMTKSQEAEVMKQMEEIEKAQAEAQAEAQSDPNFTPSAALRPKVAPWTKSEPLTKIHSILGHIAQGDTYRNELDLVYDRLKGDAEAPEYVPTESDEDSAAFEPITGRNTDPFSTDNFMFGESSGSVSVSVESNTQNTNLEQRDGQGDQSTVKITTQQSPTQEPTTQILGGVNISEFEQLHQTAKSSGMLTQDDVDAYLAQSEPNLSDDELSRLSGFDEPGSIEGKPTDLGSDPFATPTELPKRQRGLSAHQTPFFTQSDTFSEASFGMSSGSIQTVSEHDESSAETSKSPSSSESSADLALGESEDTIID